MHQGTCIYVQYDIIDKCLEIIGVMVSIPVEELQTWCYEDFFYYPVNCAVGKHWI